MPKPKKASKSASCQSCQRLKIKCDRARPSCEYCSYRGKECIYTSPELSPGDPWISPTATTASSAASSGTLSPFTPETSEGQLSFGGTPAQGLELATFDSSNLLELININSATKLMNNTPDHEIRLLNFYATHFSDIFSLRPGSSQITIWRDKVPSLWVSNDVVKTTMYCISSMSMWVLYELNTLPGVTIGEENLPLTHLTFTYFESCIKMMLELMKKPMGNTVPLALLNFIVFIASCQNPYKTIPLIAVTRPDEAQNTDLITMIMAYLTAARPHMAELVMSEFSSLLSADERIFPPSDVNYRFVTELKLQLLAETPSSLQVSLEEHNALLQAILTLEVSIYRSIYFNYPVPIFRSMFALPLQYYSLLKDKNNIVAHKILFYFASFSILFNFALFRNSNIWLEYVEYYRNISDVPSGYYKDHNDWELLELIDERRCVGDISGFFQIAYPPTLTDFVD